MLSERERRHQARFRVTNHDSLFGELAAQETRAKVRVADLSLGGAALVVDGEQVLQGLGSLELGLAGHGGEFGGSSVALVRAWKDGDARLVGVRFRQPPESFLHRVCDFLIERHGQSADRPHFVTSPRDFTLVADPKRVRKLLSYCQRHGIGFKVFELGGRPAGMLVPDAVQDGVLAGTFVWTGPGVLERGQRYHLVTSTTAGGYVLTVSLEALGASRVCFSVPEQMLLGSCRRHFRLELDADFPVHLELIHPHVRGKLVRKLALEVGPGGLSFELLPENDLLVPGTLIPSAMIWLPDGRSLGCQCFVRHVWRHQGGYRCGVELLDFADAGREQWVQALLGRASPNVVPVTPEALDDVWDVFARSGYLEEKPADLMGAMREPFRRAWGGLLATPADNQCWLYRAEGYPIATVAMSKIYSKTWLLHHLGADLLHFESKQENLDAMAELALRTAPEWAASLHPDGFALTIFNADKHFNRWSWFGFFERHHGEGQLYSQKLSMRDCQVLGRSHPPVDSGIWVREATDRELPAISEDLRRRDGPLVHAAFDFAPDRITLAAMSDCPAGAALGRRRRLYVAGSRSEVEGYAIVETGATGANIFSLYDTCRIVLLPGCGLCAGERLRDALFAHATEYFREQACPCFLYLTGPGDAPPRSDVPGFEVPVIRTVMTIDLLLGCAQNADRIWTQGWPSQH